MKKGFFFSLCYLLTCFYFIQTAKAQKGIRITLTNTASIALTDKGIPIGREKLPGNQGGLLHPLVVSSNGDTIPAQLDDMNGDNKWDELFLVTNLPANGTQTYALKWVVDKPVFPKRTSVRFGKRGAANDPVKPATHETMYAKQLPKSIGYQAYQTDGPSWENDKVGFRHYLDGRNAKDVFGKKVSYMSPDSVGINVAGAVEDNYHVMEKWGRDILAVGNSIGLGGVALILDDSLLRLGVTVNDSVNNVEKTTFGILSEGPVRSVINFHYTNWKPTDRNYSVDEITSIWPGMYAYHNSVKVAGLRGNELLGVGLVNLNTTNPVTEIKVNDKWIVLLTHDKQTYNKEWWLGLALILPRDVYLGYREAPKTGNLSNTILAKLKIANNKPVDYFAVACWELSDEGFTKPGYFKEYVQRLVEQLSAEVKVQVK